MHLGKWKGKAMQGENHSILRAIGASIFTAVLVMLSPTVSHATQPGEHHHEHRLHGHNHQQRDYVRVPEPSANVLLLIGLGVTGLVSYGMQRRKRGA
jgi:hypothetical protein